MSRNVVKIHFNHFWPKKTFLTPHHGENRPENRKLFKKLPFFYIKSTIDEKKKLVCMFWVNSKEELIKTQFFTKNYGVWSSFQNFTTNFRSKFLGFCPQSSTFGHYNGISTSLKSIMKAFSGSKSLWMLLGESGPI